MFFCAILACLCFCLVYTALLDLPVQPSATEVLGFGQTANASPSGLPFRFYEQSRRASNDPTANRSMFASVDKVPGDKPSHTAFIQYSWCAERQNMSGFPLLTDNRLLETNLWFDLNSDSLVPTCRCLCRNASPQTAAKRCSVRFLTLKKSNVVCRV